MHTLIIHPGALGDVLLSRVTMCGLRRAFPQNILIWVGNSEIGDLLLNAGEVDRTLSIEGRFLADLYGDTDQWSLGTGEVLKSCSHIVCWFDDPGDAISQRLTVFGIDSVIIQSPFAKQLVCRHFEDRYLETLHEWNIEPPTQPCSGLRVCLPSNEKVTLGKSKCLSAENIQRIAVHPGSGSPHKCTSPSILAALISQLSQEERTALTILEGPVDAKPVDQLCSLLSPGIYEVEREQSLTTIAQFLADYDLFIGHDSGLTHLAVACGVPTIILFGPTDPERWAARGQHVAVVQGEPCQCKEWSDVQCCAHRSCLKISVERVLEHAARLLNRPSIVALRSCLTNNLA
ncbi:glycosyltransferase family 9 protein [Nitrospira sp. M1]